MDDCKAIYTTTCIALMKLTSLLILQHENEMKQVKTKVKERFLTSVKYIVQYIIQMMKSDRDGALPWPFTKRFTFILVDQQDDLSQRENIEAELVPEGEKHFKRPRYRENEEWGITEFVEHSTLHTRQYIRDHTVFVKIVAEP
ncbi:TNF receptor-associated factor 4-like [Paramuricea clavata]|uniref:TNF receptor-associated factor 4-like n=1 Tax=Paramuricea clavata TaxID=317549 RepID=A0A6S7LUP3_PARCT|nr:TNF receptor-associated factor 4-like [Paramuricea clavata]